MEISVRACKPGETRTALEVCETAFGVGVSDAHAHRMESVLSHDRAFMAFDGETPIGAGGNFSFQLTVPGAQQVPTAGLTMVGVLPSHRRKGALTKMMKVLLDDAKQRSEPLSILWASEGSIYGRFGFGMSTRQMLIKADVDRMRFIEEPEPYTARMISVEEAAEIFPIIYDKVQARTPGMYSRDKTWWIEHRLKDIEPGGGGPPWYVVIEIDGQPEAYAMYRVHGDWDTVPLGKAKVAEALATGPRSEKALWKFIFGIDLVRDVECNFLPIDHPLQLMVTEQRRLRARVVDAIWTRIVDVAGALSARSYLVDDEIGLQVEDAFIPENTGVWHLQTKGSEGKASPSNVTPDVRLSAADLGSMYLGGFSFSELVRAGRGEELTAGAARRMDTLFASEVTPWCPEIF